MITGRNKRTFDRALESRTTSRIKPMNNFRISCLKFLYLFCCAMPKSRDYFIHFTPRRTEHIFAPRICVTCRCLTRQYQKLYIYKESLPCLCVDARLGETLRPEIMNSFSPHPISQKSYCLDKIPRRIHPVTDSPSAFKIALT